MCARVCVCICCYIYFIYLNSYFIISLYFYYTQYNMVFTMFFIILHLCSTIHHGITKVHVQKTWYYGKLFIFCELSSPLTMFPCLKSTVSPRYVIVSTVLKQFSGHLIRQSFSLSGNFAGTLPVRSLRHRAGARLEL